jgi:hypothetical protein
MSTTGRGYHSGAQKEEWVMTIEGLIKRLRRQQLGASEANFWLLQQRINDLQRQLKKQSKK